MNDRMNRNDVDEDVALPRHCENCQGTIGVMTFAAFLAMGRVCDGCYAEATDNDSTRDLTGVCSECENDPESVCRVCGRAAVDTLDLAAFEREQAN